MEKDSYRTIKKRGKIIKKNAEAIGMAWKKKVK